MKNNKETLKQRVPVPRMHNTQYSITAVCSFIKQRVKISNGKHKTKITIILEKPSDPQMNCATISEAETLSHCLFNQSFVSAVPSPVQAKCHLSLQDYSEWWCAAIVWLLLLHQQWEFESNRPQIQRFSVGLKRTVFGIYWNIIQICYLIHLTRSKS